MRSAGASKLARGKKQTSGNPKSERSNWNDKPSDQWRGKSKHRAAAVQAEVMGAPLAASMQAWSVPILIFSKQVGSQVPGCQKTGGEPQEEEGGDLLGKERKNKGKGRLSWPGKAAEAKAGKVLGSLKRKNC